MPAPFTKDLCGYRAHGKPNTSDSTSKQSVDLGIALFDALGVSRDAKGEDETGLPLAKRVLGDLNARLHTAGSSRLVGEDRAPAEFEQYHHVGAFDQLSIEPSREYIKAWAQLTRGVRRQMPPSAIDGFNSLAESVECAVADEVAARRSVLNGVAQESLLHLDVTVSNNLVPGYPELDIGLSLKWSLRTDRAQDCRTQGAKLAALRRGRMPHFAAVTIEPRPYMLNLLCGGSGDIDCVYHLHLQALNQAIDLVLRPKTDRKSRRTVDTFDRLIDQRRLRDYDELVTYALTLT
jgi:hypothetical protein